MINNQTGESKDFEENAPVKVITPFGNILSSYVVELLETDILSQYDKSFILKAKAERNGAYKEAEPLEYRVTAPAQAPIVSVDREYFSLPANEPITIEISASVEGMISDEVKYQWWVALGEIDEEGSVEGDDILIEGANTPSIKIANKELAPQEGVFNTGAGSFYCIVTNYVNGTETSVISNRIGVFPG